MRSKEFGSPVLRCWVVVFALLAGLVGCGKPPAAEQPNQAADQLPVAAIPNPAAVAASQSTPTSDTPLAPTIAPRRLDAPFTDAVTLQAPEGSTLPPEKTLAGQPTSRFRAGVEQEWAGTALAASGGKADPVVVTLETDLGNVEVTLFPELAPNHVRNLMILSKLGYYNGLTFERVIRQEVMQDGNTKQRVEVVTTGCPAGDGEPGHGHLGYFLKPEFNGFRHEEGTVGFVREDDPNSACCRLYICLTPAPILDGQVTAVGKVTRGMDVIRAIADRPVKNASTSPENEMPREPVKLKTVSRK